jgi:hypothetical protein
MAYSTQEETQKNLDSNLDGTVDNADRLQNKLPSELQSEIGKNISLSEYRSEVNRSIRNDAMQNFELGLIKLGYLDGFYDVFVDESKISSVSGDASVKTGTNGNLSLISVGNTTSRPTDSSSDSQNNAFAIRIKTEQDLKGIVFDVSSNTTGVSRAFITDSSGNLIESKSISGQVDDIEFNIELTGNTEYWIGVDNDGGSYTRGYVNASLPIQGDGFTIEGDVGDVFSGPYTGSTQLPVVNNIAPKKVGSNGSLTSTTFNLGYTATEWTPTADYQLNGQSIDYLELQDGSGNQIKRITDLTRLGDAISISTSATSYKQKIELSSDGTDTPVINSYESGLDDAE